MKYSYAVLLLLGLAACQADTVTSGVTTVPGSVNYTEFTQERPHIVFIFVDDMGWNNTSAYGIDVYPTPNLDRLAESGMLFTDAYANYANCAPTRAALLSGQVGSRTGVHTVGSSARGKAELRKLVPVENDTVLASHFTTFAEVLKESGYHTAFAGKWHLGRTPDTLPTGQGFDVNYGGSHKGHPSSYFSPWSYPNFVQPAEGYNLTEELTTAGIDWFTKHVDDGPCLLMMSYYAVHGPLENIPEYMPQAIVAAENAPHHDPRYVSMVLSMDAQVGRLLDTLDTLGVTEETLVVFTSDNGGAGFATHMAPLRGSKGMYYEGGIRVPFIASWPGQIPAQSYNHTPIQSCDLYPTFLSMAGAALPEGPLDGVDLSEILVDPNANLERDTLYWHFPCYLSDSKLNVKDGRFGEDDIWRTTPCSVIRQGDWKYIHWYEDGIGELYNLREDPSEATDLSQEHPDVVSELASELARYLDEIDAPFPVAKNPVQQS